MRKTLLILSLAALTVLAGASDAFAQVRMGVGRAWGYSPGVSSFGGRGSYYSPNGYYGGRGYSPYYQGYGNAYQMAPSYYYTAPRYYVAPTYVDPVQIRESYYVAPAPVQHSARLTVLVPAANAQVWFDNAATAQQGTERSFESPPLEPNQTFTYSIKARWMESGQAVTRERRVNVQAGQSVSVNFRVKTSESVPAPR